MLGGGGISSVLEEMRKAIDIACASCYKHPSCLSSRRKKDFSILSLQKAARTNSGGQSFSAIQSMVDLSSILIIPQSSLATPLLINIYMGAHDGEIGIKASIKTETIFELKEIDPVHTNIMTDTGDNASADFEEKDQGNPNNDRDTTTEGSKIEKCSSVILSVEYENFVFMPIRSKPSNFGDCSNDDNDDRGNGSISNFVDRNRDEDFSSYQVTSKRHIAVGPGLLKLRRHLS